MVWNYILTALVAYMLGSVSFGMIVSRASGGPDLHKVGSGNTGATNALRTMGLKAGILVFLGDAFKAIAACLLGSWICGNPDGAVISYGMLLAGFCVIIGHCWPLFEDFKGGKGVASSCGVMVVCFPLQSVICFALTAALIAATRYVSLGSMFMLTLFGILVCTMKAGGDWIVIVWCCVLAVLCITRHHANIGRLMRGEERKLSFHSKKN